MACWLMAAMEHLMIICLFSDGLHGMAHLFSMSESLHVARTYSQRRRGHTEEGRASTQSTVFAGWTPDKTRQDQPAFALSLKQEHLFLFFGHF